MRLSDSVKADNSFKVIRQWSQTPAHVLHDGEQIFKHYWPQESDPTIDATEKLGILREWLTKDFTLFANVGYHRSDFEKMILESNLVFRHGTSNLANFSLQT